MATSKPVRITHTARLPDPVKLARYLKSPELGPRVLFFSGGTALTGVSRELKRYTHNSIHLVTPFDSGGSSAKLRKAFAMPSIGDLRSRLTALADENITGHPDVYQLFTYRFPTTEPPDALLTSLESMIRGKEPRIDVYTKGLKLKALLSSAKKVVHPKEGVIGLAPKGYAGELFRPDRSRATFDGAGQHGEGAVVLLFQFGDEWFHR